jgi:exodeoxyribonuclease-5
MVPKSIVDDLLSFGKKIIVCGDPNQLDPVGDEPGFLVNGEINTLTQLMRQAETNPIVYLANRVLQDKPIHNGIYGNVLVINDDEIIPQMYGIVDVILCGTNKTRELFNSEIRRLAGFSSILPRVGERVICRRNNWNESIDGIYLTNGTAGYVTDIKHDSFNHISMKMDFMAKYLIKRMKKKNITNLEWTIIL